MKAIAFIAFVSMLLSLGLSLSFDYVQDIARQDANAQERALDTLCR